MGSSGVRSSRVVVLVLLAAFAATPLGVFAQEPVEPEANPGGRGAASVILHMVGGAIVGGWLGWMGSQVSYSDWNEAVDGDFASQRRGWVLGGMVTGAVLSQLVGPTLAPAEVPVLDPFRGANRNVITRAEIQSSGAMNAFNLVQSLRPEWLRTRGVNRWAESPRGQVDESGADIDPGEATIVVYLDRARLGGVNALRNLSIEDLQQLEWVPAQAAAVRYGSGHAHGVIQLSTEFEPGGFGVAGGEAPDPAPRIREAAMEVFLERGYEGATLEAVGDRAGVSWSALRAVYPDKAQLFAAIVPQDLAERLEVRLRQWIQTGGVEAEDRLVALLSERRDDALLLLARSSGSAWSDTPEQLANALVEAAGYRCMGHDTGVLEPAEAQGIERASRRYVTDLAEALEANPEPDSLERAVRLVDRYHRAGLSALLDI